MEGTQQLPEGREEEPSTQDAEGAASLETTESVEDSQRGGTELPSSVERLENRLKELDEVLKVRKAQIERTEQQLLQLQQRAIDYEDVGTNPTDTGAGEQASMSLRSKTSKKHLKDEKVKGLTSGSVFNLSIIGNKLSWFTRPNTATKVTSLTHKLDTSNVVFCAHMKDFSTKDYDVYMACVDGWCCLVKLITGNQRRFIKRLKMLEELPEHSNICRNWFHDVQSKTNRCRVFGEWFEVNLAQVIERRSEKGEYFTPEQVHAIILDVVNGVDYLHSYSILHRRLSTSSVFVLLDESSGNVVRVCIGNIDSAKVVTRRVIPRNRVENPRFIAPEVLSASKGNTYSFPSDVWSLGLILYSILTLKVPYGSLDTEGMQEMIRRGKRPEDLHLDNSYASLVELYIECTRVIPEERPTSLAIKQVLTTCSSILEQRRMRDMNIGHTYQPSREEARFIEGFLVVGCPIGVENAEAVNPDVLFQYPSDKSVQNVEMVMSFCMAHKRSVTRLRRSFSSSKINEKLFASREAIEHSRNFAIFVMMEGNELRYGMCVYFEEPVAAVPSFFEVKNAYAIASTNPSVVDWREGMGMRISATVGARISKAPSFQRFSDVRRRDHQRVISDGKILIKDMENGELVTNYIEFTHRCYVFYSKWPFFKLHFEVLWSILVQERLSRFSNYSPEGAPHDPTEGVVYKMLESYYTQPLPQPGSAISSLHLHAVSEPIKYSSESMVESVAEWCYPCIFRSLSPKNIIKLFRALILEEKIIFICEDSGILTSCIAGLTALLKPYAWQGPFLPIVPNGLENVFDSPVPYVIGFLSTPADLQESQDQFVVQIQKDLIKSPYNLPKLPASDLLLDAFTTYSNEIRISYNPSNPCKTSESDRLALKKLLVAISNWHNHIIEQIASSPFFSSNFKWTDSKSVDSLLKSLSSTDRDFYKKLTSSSHFNIFAVSGIFHSVVSLLHSKRDNQKHIEKIENIFNSSTNKTK